MSKDKKIDISGETEKSGCEEMEKTCFVMMPIADHPDYDIGHFDRVYEYLIKPACIAAGFKPSRADENKASNMIMFDILKNIVECDIAICDLSSKNANVFYELGLRQAFNKKTILITDGIDKPPFDIASFRYSNYSPSLRVDTVSIEILKIKDMLIATDKAPETDVNSIVKLLQIDPAKVDHVKLNESESILFNMINKMQNQLTSLTHSKLSTQNASPLVITEGKTTFAMLEKRYPDLLRELNFEIDEHLLGTISSINNTEILFSLDGDITGVPNMPHIKERIYVTSRTD